MPKAFHDQRNIAWCKFHMRWMRSPSHVDLDALVLGVGLMLMALANERGRRPDGSGALVNGAGRPLSLQAMARETHATPDEVESTIAALVEVGTMAFDGEYVTFPNLQKWQEDRSAERVRRFRAKRDDRVTAGVTVTQAVTREVTHRRSDDQIDPPKAPPGGLFACNDGSEESQPARPKKPTGKPPARKDKRAAWWWRMAQASDCAEDVEAVVSAYRQRWPRRNPGELERGLIAERLLSGDAPHTVDEIIEAIEGCSRSDFHVSGGHTGLELIVRDRAQVEMFRGKLEAARASPTGRVTDPRAHNQNQPQAPQPKTTFLSFGEPGPKTAA